MKRKTARTIVMRDDGRWIDKKLANGITRSHFVYYRRRFPAFKVLRNDGRPPYQGNFIWDLPRYGRAGNWTEPEFPGKLRICRLGLHLTICPKAWGNPQSHRVYLVEYEVLTKIPKQEDKFCVRRARLLRRVSWREARRMIGAARRVK